MQSLKGIPLFAGIRKSLLVLALPALELLSLRLFLHFVLRKDIGFRYGTDFDYILPVPIAVIVFILSLERAGPVLIRPQKRILVANLIALFLFLVLNILFYEQSSHLAWNFSLFLVISTSFASFISPAECLRNSNRLVFLPCLGIAFLFPLYMNSLDALYASFTAATMPILEGVFKLVFWGSASVSKIGADLTISHPKMNVLIGKGCAGLEGLFLFTFLYFVFLGLKKRQFGFWFTGLYYFGGLLLIFQVNLVRIVLLFWSGVLFRSILGFETGTILIKGLAHVHLGWLLYALAIGLYFAAILPHPLAGTLKTRIRFKTDRQAPT